MFQIAKSENEWSVKKRDGQSFRVDWSEVPVLSVNFSLCHWEEAISFARQMEGFK
jgi:hypothetical protein